MRILRKFSGRIGRRGGALFFVGVLDLVFATSLRVLHNPITMKVYGSIVSLDVWAWVWMIACAFAWVSMFLESDRAGFTVSAMIFTVWGALALSAWYSGDNPAGWLSATFFLVLDGLILILATWPEPVSPPPLLIDSRHPDAIITADDHGLITGWLGSAEKMFGWSTHEIIGKPITAIMPDRYRDAHEAGIQRVRETGKSELAGQALEAEGLRQDGSEFPVIVVVGIYPFEGKIVLTTTVRDVSEAT